MSLNDPSKPPTWNSPDIVLTTEPVYVGGVWQSPGNVGFLTNPIAALSNLSSVDAINAVVKVSCAFGGIGNWTLPLTSQVVTIPAGIHTASVPIPMAAAYEALQTKYQIVGPIFPVAIFVDIYHPYDSNPNDNHGVNSSDIWVAGKGAVVYPIQLNNFTTSAIAFNLSIVGTNSIGATLEETRVVLPANTGDGECVIQYPAQPSGSNADVTVFATDDSGNPIGGFTARLYFN